MAIQALVTTEGAAAANAANASGFTITIPQFSVSATAGALAATRTFAGKNAAWFSAAVTTATTVSATTVKYTCVIPTGAALAATPITEIYLEDTTGAVLYVVAQPDATTPIIYDPAGSLTIEIDVSIASIPSSSYSLVNTSAIDLATHENNAAMHPKSNYGSTVAPSATDDAAAGYNEGSIWVNTLTNTAYVLVDKTNGAAVWRQIDNASVGGILNNYTAITPPTAASDSTLGYSIGSVWVDTAANISYTAVDVTAGAAIWSQAGSTSSVAATAPVTPQAGQIWLNTANDITYLWDGNTWIDIAAAGGGKVKNNYAAALDPTVTDDANAGYSVGSIWVNAASGSTYIATAVSAGAAVWSRFGGAAEWFATTGAYTAKPHDALFIDTTLLAATVTLPLAPTTGTQVKIVDAKGTFATNNCTVARNGSTIMGLAADMILNTSNRFLTLTANGTDWRITS